ncbi:hypothetical protein Z517_09891 [Fonsecaea pedrosoi CBS 271.37]|uniref:DUF7924 domain-containing protein n=1 Tax=Fonsecaea pedrosoi CBS 271.37 TaxID=1442368 RepID=A0A0D2GFT8_9EURO|nr:uncharacterized protein Z517_09891 [Fonsecaea pedrosoi CBS 271.37]KIW77445.1 hypothetical protein Z517_09891 [Fonsecaea pedrosoi CBS 271.37]
MCVEDMLSHTVVNKVKVHFNELTEWRVRTRLIPFFHRRLQSGKRGPEQLLDPHTLENDDKHLVLVLLVLPISHWAETQRWPRRYLNDSGGTTYLSAKKTSLRPKESDREVLLEAWGSYTEEPELDITNEDKALSVWAVDREANDPQARVIQDIARVLVPSAETLATFGAQHLDRLVESVDEGRNNSMPVTKPRPQPDYSAGFKRSAFTETQLQKLQPFLGDLADTCFFTGTWYMYFRSSPSKSKCTYHDARRSKGVVELFRLVKREIELRRKILAFSISHDDRSIRIYGHYLIIEGTSTTFYRHLIRAFNFTELHGKEKWTAYKFTKSVYDTWMPTHFQSLYSVIDVIPSDLSLDIFEGSDLQFPSSSGLPQDSESHHPLESAATDGNVVSLLEPENDTSGSPLAKPTSQLQS